MSVEPGSPSAAPAWDYADVLDGPLYVAREPRDDDRAAIKSGHFTILTAGDYFDGGGPVIARLEWLCQIVNERAELLAAGERDKADLRELRELVTQVHAALDGLDLPFTHDSPKLILELREAGERDKAEIEALTAAVEGLLDVGTRSRSGDPSLDPEEWFAIRDYARKVLKDGR